MRKVFIVSISTCAFTVQVMAAISSGPLPDINPISSMIVEISMFHWTCTKLMFQHHLLSSKHLQTMIASLQPTGTLFSSLHLALLSGKPIYFSWFLTLRSQTLTPASVHLFFISFHSYIFYFQAQSCLFLGRLVCFPFTAFPF